MSVAELQRQQTRNDGGVPARRAVVRWAWRLVRREWRQQVLVLALITAAVAATILGAAVATNTPPPADSGFGTANHLAVLPGTDPHLAADIAAIRAHFAGADVIENENLATGLVQAAQLRAQDPAGSYGRPMLALTSGRYPSGAGEVAMTKRLATTFGLHVGDLWHQANRTWRVVGLVENPQDLLDDFALVSPGQLSAPSQVTVLFDSTAHDAATFPFRDGATVVVPHQSNGLNPAVIVLAIAVVGLIFVGLVSVAGFTVLGQRRLRSLGMLSSLGATDRNVHLVMVANGAVVGVIGALAGTVIGFAAWIAYAPMLSTSAHHRVDWTHLPWWLILAAIVLPVLTSILASRHPARSLAQVPVVAALSERPAPPKAVHRSAVPGIVSLVGGILLLAESGGWGGNSGKDLLFQVAGLLAAVTGLLFLAPLAIAVLAVNARHAPIAVRIAMRDLARYRARSGAALAATSFAVLIAVLTTLLTAGRFADPVDYFGPNLAADQLVVYAAGNNPGGQSGSATTGAAPSAARQQDYADAIATSLGSHDILTLESTDAVVLRHDRGGPGVIYVATPALLARYGISPAAIDPTTLLITSRQGLQHTSGLQLLFGFGGPNSPPPNALNNPKIQTFTSLPTDTSAPNLLVTAYAVRTLKLKVTAPDAWLVQAARPLTPLQINGARQTAAAARMTIEPKNDAPSLSEVRSYATGTGILLALGILAMTVGLIRSEAAGELRTLTATGASSRTRRTITAATAGALGLLGAVLGTAVAYLATAAFFRSQLTERMGHPPVLDLVLILVGLPVVAAIGGWLFAGREPTAIAHRSLE
jgi:putative ABC transport system permease protein